MKKEDIILYIENNKELIRKHTLKEIADKLYVSDGYLSKIITKHYRLKYHELQMKFRYEINSDADNDVNLALAKFNDTYFNELQVFKRKINEDNQMVILTTTLFSSMMAHLMEEANRKQIKIISNITMNNAVMFNFKQVNKNQVIIKLDNTEIIIGHSSKDMIYFSYLVYYLLYK